MPVFVLVLVLAPSLVLALALALVPVLAPAHHNHCTSTSTSTSSSTIPTPLLVLAQVPVPVLAPVQHCVWHQYQVYRGCARALLPAPHPRSQSKMPSPGRLKQERVPAGEQVVPEAVQQARRSHLRPRQLPRRAGPNEYEPRLHIGTLFLYPKGRKQCKRIFQNRPRGAWVTSSGD